ncbi:MAG: DUF402 domain-containing protein [Chloroflexia bacterium]
MSRASPTRLEVESLYYTGDVNKRWCSYLLAEETDKLVLVRANGSPLWSSKGILWMPPGPAIEIYPRNEWFNIFCGLGPGFGSDPTFHRYYINIALPPILGDGSLAYIDLDLDIGVNDDFSYVIYDEDEFLAHCDLWRYPPEVCETAHTTFNALVSRVERRDSLFQEWERYGSLVPEHFVTGTEAALFPRQEAGRRE